MLRPLKHILEYVFLRGMILVFGLFPYEMGKVWAGRVLGALGWALAGTQRRRALENLAFAFPEKTQSERRAIARTVFYNFGHQAIEFVQLRHIDQAWMDKYFEFEPTGLALTREAVKDKRGIMFVAAHFGNWEMLNHSLVLKTGTRINLLVAPLSNPYANTFICKIRRRLGTNLIYPDDAGPDILKALARGESAAFTSDQNAGRRGLFVPFFNRPASTHRGAAIFSYLSGAEVFFVFNIRLPGGRFRVELVPMGRIDRKTVANKDQAILEFTLKWVDLLEKYVRKYPEQYFWVHNRWKTRPLPEDVIQTRIATDLEPYDHWVGTQSIG